MLSPDMKKAIAEHGQLSFHPATKARWKDLEELFGERGACAGCWCMWWRIRRREWQENKGEGNRRKLKQLVNSNNVPGILAYAGNKPIGWCSVAPREEFPVLEGSRTMKRLDDQPVWSIVCLFVEKEQRRNGVASSLLNAAAEYAFRRGAEFVEGYPVVPKKDRMPDAFAFTGVPAAFENAGFKVVKKATASRWIVRKRKG